MSAMRQRAGDDNPLLASTWRGLTARCVAMALFAALIGFAGNAALPPLDRDEARFAQATAQMLESGDFIAIRFQDQERNKKPAGVHWLQAASVAAFTDVDDRQIWAYRLPSVAGIALAAIFTLLIGERLFNPLVGGLAGAIIAASPIAAVEATIAKTDAFLLATIVCAFAAAAAIIQRAETERPAAPGSAALSWTALFWTSVGASVLIKGPVIFAAIAPFALIYAIRRRNVNLWRAFRPGLGLAIVLAIAVPWALAVNAATEGRFFAEAIGKDFLGKVGAAQESHWGPPGYHTLFVFVLMWPALPLIVRSLGRTWTQRADWRALFLLAWLIPGWIIFELTATKLPHYTLPFYPALALMVAWLVIERPTSNAAPPMAQRLGAVAFGIIGVGMGLLFVAPAAIARTTPSLFALLGAGAFGAASIIVARRYWRGQNARALLGAIALSGLFAWIGLHAVAPRLDAVKTSPMIASVVKAANLHEISDAAAPTILSGYREPSAIFLLGTKTVLADGAAAARAAERQPGGAIVVEARQLKAFEAAAADARLNLRRLAVIDSFNYSKGKSISLVVYENR